MQNSKFVTALLVVLGLILTARGQLEKRQQHIWQTPGCHRVGHTRRVSIPDCVEFSITTNACRGFCESYSILTAWQNRLASRSHQTITSVGQCCNIMETEDVNVEVMCVGGPRKLVFKSAKSCSCFHCKKY